MNSEKIIPQHTEGVQTNTESSVELKTEQAAKKFFEKIKHRLLGVNNWHQYAGSATADFKLRDDKGNPVNRNPQKGDHFEIDIPGPGSKTGEGNDWVHVEAIEENENYLGIRVRPASNPKNKKEGIAHFFSEESTSSFIIKREGRKVTAGVYGRNEKPNKNTGTLIDKIRNTTVAVGGMSGLSKLQWKSLVNGLLKN